MAHINESWHIWMNHGTNTWVMENMNESWHIWMSHGTYEWIMAHMKESGHSWIVMVQHCNTLQQLPSVAGNNCRVLQAIVFLQKKLGNCWKKAIVEKTIACNTRQLFFLARSDPELALVQNDATTLHHTAPHYNTQKHTATHRNTLQQHTLARSDSEMALARQISPSPKTLQHTATTHCNNTLQQHTATTHLSEIWFGNGVCAADFAVAKHDIGVATLDYAHLWHMSHVTHGNESCHTYEWVMSHIWMSHVTHMNESCHTYEWVESW